MATSFGNFTALQPTNAADWTVAIDAKREVARAVRLAERQLVADTDAVGAGVAELERIMRHRIATEASLRQWRAVADELDINVNDYFPGGA